MKTQKNFTLSEEALFELEALAELYQTSTKALEVAIHGLYQEKRKERRITTTVERKAGIAPEDALPTVVEKIKAWIQKTIPNETPDYQKRQAQMAYHAVVADRYLNTVEGNKVFDREWSNG